MTASYDETLCEFTYHCRIVQICEFALFILPNDVVEHRHKYNYFNKIFWFTVQFSHHLLDFSEDLQCGVSWEYSPLEVYWLPIESI